MFRKVDLLVSSCWLLLVLLFVPGCSPPPLETVATEFEPAKTASSDFETSAFETSAFESSGFKPPKFEMPEFNASEFESSFVRSAPMTVSESAAKPSFSEPAAKLDVMPRAALRRSAGGSASFNGGSSESSGLPSSNGIVKRSSSLPPPSPQTSSQFDQFKESQPQAMAVMAPAVAEPERPPTQTSVEVFYATDRQSKYGISPGDWLRLHSPALIAMLIYLVTFGGVFLSQRKVAYGFIAFVSLCAFLYLGQSATVKWQKQKRLAVNNDPSYLSEIRTVSLDGGLEYGTCKVTIPPDHRTGHVDKPSLFKLEFVENADKHVVLQRVIREENKDTFFHDLRSSVDASDDRQALVFVHGYNVSFENAVKRTAQIAHDLQFEGPPICYSWSSHGALANYTKDMANADATVVALQTFLQDLVKETDKTTIHLVAHSMGNRALLQALDRIAVGSPQAENVFGQFVMAAPDVSAVDFRHRFAPAALRLANSVTLYASSRDRALLASTEIHGHNRAGLAGPNLVVMEGMDTIDVSEIDTSLIGHSYYGDHPELIRDLRAVVELAAPADKRQWLTRIIVPGSIDYFRFLQYENQAADESSPGFERR